MASNRCADPCCGILFDSPNGYRFCSKCGNRYHAAPPAAPDPADVNPAGSDAQLDVLAHRVKLLEDDARDRATMVVDLERRLRELEASVSRTSDPRPAE